MTDDEALTDYDLDATGTHLLFSISRATNPTGKVGDGAEPSTFRLDGGPPPVRLQLLPNAMPPSRVGGNLVW